jgi:hypothetical protein
MNLATPKARAKHELLFNKPAPGYLATSSATKEKSFATLIPGFSSTGVGKLFFDF